jgi:signal transduction histidine kinase
MATLDLNRLVDEVCAVVEHTFGLDRVVLDRRYGTDIPAIMGDEEKLKQCVMNLLNNAYDAIESDGVITITTSFDEGGGEAVLSVADTGCGIPEENMARLFEPFFTTKGVGEGTGLGLSVTFGIIKDHGGSIRVRSPLLPSMTGEQVGNGEGAVFTIHLPVNRKRKASQGEG